MTRASFAIVWTIFLVNVVWEFFILQMLPAEVQPMLPGLLLVFALGIVLATFEFVFAFMDSAKNHPIKLGDECCSSTLRSDKHEGNLAVISPWFQVRQRAKRNRGSRAPLFPSISSLFLLVTRSRVTSASASSHRAPTRLSHSSPRWRVVVSAAASSARLTLSSLRLSSLGRRQVFTIDSFVFFGTADKTYQQLKVHLQRQIERRVPRAERVKMLVFDLTGVTGIDPTAKGAFSSLFVFLFFSWFSLSSAHSTSSRDHDSERSIEVPLLTTRAALPATSFLSLPLHSQARSSRCAASSSPRASRPSGPSRATQTRPTG